MRFRKANLNGPSFATGEKEKVEPANSEDNFLETHARAFRFTCKIVQNINMADETTESCSFHEMGLDDRLVKVNYILGIQIDRNCSF